MQFFTFFFKSIEFTKKKIINAFFFFYQYEFQRWLPILKKYQVELPLECPFHESRDIFHPQQAAKFQHRTSQWTCGLCGKSFYAEKHLDAHFDSRHRSNINMVKFSPRLWSKKFKNPARIHTGSLRPANFFLRFAEIGKVPIEIQGFQVLTGSPRPRVYFWG